MSFTECYSSRKEKPTPQVTCVPHLVCEEGRLPLTQRIKWGGHCQPHTDIDIRVLVPLPSCCHFTLWEQCNGVVKGWEYPGSGRTNGEKALLLSLGQSPAVNMRRAWVTAAFTFFSSSLSCKLHSKPSTGWNQATAKWQRSGSCRPCP